MAADSRAASAVEFALLAPVFFTLMFGVTSSTSIVKRSPLRK
jgi:Flp pilus assembly protein TadG